MTKEIIISLVTELNGRFSNKEIYQSLEIPKTTFYRWLNSTEKNNTDVEVITKICRENYRKSFTTF